MEISVTSRRNSYVGVGTQLPVFHLEPQDTKHLVDVHMRAARCHRSDNGNVSVRAGHDRSKRGSVRTGSFLRPAADS